MFDLSLSDAQIAAAIAFAGGIGLGLAARLGRFCTLGAIEDQLYGGNDHRLRMWGLAIGASLLVAFGLMAAGHFEAERTSYLGAPGWNPLAHVVGGLVFGFGMAWAGNCGFGALARLGGGDLRSFVIVLVMGISAYVVMSGPLSGLRLLAFPPDLIATDGPTGIAHGLAGASGLPPALWGAIAGVAVLALALARPDFRQNRAMVGWGLFVGLVIGANWAAMSLAAQASFEATAIEGFSFAGPLGETILYAMTSSGSPITFAVGGMAGVWVGAFVGSLVKGHFRWEACEDPRELRRQIFGAAMMGGGAVLALGCSVGQGLTAMSLLTYGAPITLVSIYAGAALGLRSLIVGFSPA